MPSHIIFVKKYAFIIGQHIKLKKIIKNVVLRNDIQTIFLNLTADLKKKNEAKMTVGSFFNTNFPYSMIVVSLVFPYF